MQPRNNLWRPRTLPRGNHGRMVFPAGFESEVMLSCPHRCALSRRWGHTLNTIDLPLRTVSATPSTTTEQSRNHDERSLEVDVAASQKSWREEWLSDE